MVVYKQERIVWGRPQQAPAWFIPVDRPVGAGFTDNT
jgi:hypothetical protein